MYPIFKNILGCPSCGDKHYTLLEHHTEELQAGLNKSSYNLTDFIELLVKAETTSRNPQFSFSFFAYFEVNFSLSLHILPHIFTQFFDGREDFITRYKSQNYLTGNLIYLTVDLKIFTEDLMDISSKELKTEEKRVVSRIF